MVMFIASLLMVMMTVVSMIVVKPSPPIVRWSCPCLLLSGAGQCMSLLRIVYSFQAISSARNYFFSWPNFFPTYFRNVYQASEHDLRNLNSISIEFSFFKAISPAWEKLNLCENEFWATQHLQIKSWRDINAKVAKHPNDCTVCTFPYIYEIASAEIRFQTFSNKFEAHHRTWFYLYMW